MGTTTMESTEPAADEPPPKRLKLNGRAFYESIGSPKLVLAPMVDQSEFAWRVLTRSFMEPDATGKVLAYTPMFHARLFKDAQTFRDKHFQPLRSNARTALGTDSDVLGSQPYLDGRADIDRPLTVQFCANDPEQLLEAAQHVQSHCDAVDLNLGCPQRIARSGNYGAFLQEDQDLIYRLINTLHLGLDVPVTAKIRILETKEATLAYAKNVLSAGASILTVHGRRREQKGHNTGLADWSMIRYLRENLPQDTVLFANGNILRHEDIARCLKATAADAVMSAEGNLHDPTIFAPRPVTLPGNGSYWRSPVTGKGGYRVDYVFRRYLSIIYKHVLEQSEPDRAPLFDPSNPSSEEPAIHDPYAQDEDGPPRKKQKKGKRGGLMSPSLAGMQAHLFNLLRALVAANTDVRDALAKAHGGNMAAFEYVLALTERSVRRGLQDYAQNSAKYEEAELSEEARGKETQADITDHESSLKAVQACKMPWWVCQSYVRPLPKEALEKGSMSLSKKQKKELGAKDIARTHQAQAAQIDFAPDAAHGQDCHATTRDKAVQNGFDAIQESKEKEEAQAPHAVPSPALICS